MRIYFVIFSLIIGHKLSLAIPSGTPNENYSADERIMRQCLTDKSGEYSIQELQRVGSFSNWKNSEEIPCFTRCLSAGKDWFDIETGKWKKQQITKDLGDQMYDYCSNELERDYENMCEFVHQGFRCLKQAEENINQGRLTLINCAADLGADMKEIHEYSEFPEKEAIPCLFQCLADKMALYTSTNEWEFSNWQKVFGHLEKGADTRLSICRLSEEERAAVVDKCAWMYKEFHCLERLTNKRRTDTTISDNEELEVTGSITIEEEQNEETTNLSETTTMQPVTEESLSETTTIFTENTD